MEYFLSTSSDAFIFQTIKLLAGGGGGGEGIPAFNVFPPLHSCTLWRCICETGRISGVTQLRTEKRPWVILGSEPEIPRADDTQRIGPDSASSQQAS